ncbi:Ras suppressor protein 1 [Mortierella sp. GBA30]|nr:Ras suppressor protein 1 [Mortierella sp. GBA30]
MSRPSVRETIAAARAKLAQEQAKAKSIHGGQEDELHAFASSGVPGVKRTSPAQRRQTDVEILGHAQKSIKSLIANAKGTGIMNLSSRELTEIPLEIWNMYHVDPDKVVVDFNSTGSAWYDAVDLTRLIAADNRITFIDARIQEFGALVAVDLRSNELTSLPEEFGKLERLVNLNLSSNKFTELPPVLFTLTTLLDLQLGNNQLSGSLDPAIGNLCKLESLDVSGNKLTDLPQELSQLKAIRKLLLSKNQLERLDVGILAQMPKITELEISDNRLGCLFSGLSQRPMDEEEGQRGLELPTLVRLDARNAGIQRITDAEGKDSDKPRIGLTAVKELLLSHNSLDNLENLLFVTPQLYHLDLRTNKFSELPLGVLDLSSLRYLDMANNRMEHMPAELGSMVDLATFVWEGNPIRNVPRSVTNTEALMKLLRQRQANDFPTSADTARVESLAVSSPNTGSPAASVSRPDTPSTHPSRSPSGSARSATGTTAATSTVPVSTSPKRPSKNLNLVKKALKEISKDEILEGCSDPQVALLDFNALTAFPVVLQETVGMTLTQISIHHNKISEFPFFLSFPSLISLDLSDNMIATLSTTESSSSSGSAVAEEIGLNNFPNLNELHLMGNRLTELPEWLPKAFPKLKTLVAGRNKIATIDPRSFEGLLVLDLSGNEIGTLPPLLGYVKSIKTLNVDGNLFRVPRRQIMEQGTEAVMEYLRGRVPS